LTGTTTLQSLTNGGTIPGNGQSLDRYAYAANNPTTYVDPSGLKARVLDPGPDFNRQLK
jgi:hypothetical protein